MRVARALNLPTAEETNCTDPISPGYDHSPVVDKNKTGASDVKKTENMLKEIKLDSEQNKDCCKNTTNVGSGHTNPAAGSAGLDKNQVGSWPCPNQNLTLLVCDVKNGQSVFRQKLEANEVDGNNQSDTRCANYDSIQTLCCHSPCAGKPGDDPLVIEDCAHYKVALSQKDVPSDGRREAPPCMAAQHACDIVPKNDLSDHSDLVDFGKLAKKPNKIRTLEYLNLSGCYQITDVGLR